jgi:hypothetical protein
MCRRLLVASQRGDRAHSDNDDDDDDDETSRLSADERHIGHGGARHAQKPSAANSLGTDGHDRRQSSAGRAGRAATARPDQAHRKDAARRHKRKVRPSESLDQAQKPAARLSVWERLSGIATPSTSARASPVIASKHGHKRSSSTGTDAISAAAKSKNSSPSRVGAVSAIGHGYRGVQPPAVETSTSRTQSASPTPSSFTRANGSVVRLGSASPSSIAARAGAGARAGAASPTLTVARGGGTDLSASSSGPSHRSLPRKPEAVPVRLGDTVVDTSKQEAAVERAVDASAGMWEPPPVVYHPLVERRATETRNFDMVREVTLRDLRVLASHRRVSDLNASFISRVGSGAGDGGVKGGVTIGAGGGRIRSSTLRRRASVVGGHFKMAVAGLFEEMSAYRLVGSPLFRRFGDPHTETGYRAWRWNQLYARTPVVIALASVIFAAASYSVVFLLVHHDSLLFIVLLGLTVLHTMINFALSVLAWRDRPWIDLHHPGLLWSVAMRVFCGVGIAMLFVDGNKTYIPPLLTCALLLALLLLLQLVAFMIPLAVTVGLVAVDFAMLGVTGWLEHELGWHDEAYILTVIGWYVPTHLHAPPRTLRATR